MKLQNFTVIFAIIIIPITLILSAYIGTQIDTASLQQSYDTTLLDATHDAVLAFELNTENNEYSTNADSIRRDIEASINVFSNSLASGLGIPGANTEAIMPYIPAVLVTLYDGYYIYSPSEYTYKTKENIGGTWTNTTKTGYKHILKPYVYYSARYESGSNFVVVSYSLDNYISFYGVVNGVAISKSGYLSTADFRNNIIGGEYLHEQIAYKTNDISPVTFADVPFVYKNGIKVYNINGGWYTLTDLKLKTYGGASSPDSSAVEYKTKSEAFMNYINDKGISNIVRPSNCKNISSTDSTEILTTDPEDQTSAFNQHKREIIKQSIQDNLNNAMAIYNEHSGSLGTNAYFHMPKLTETDWEKIVTNVNFVTFMQGLGVGNKIYNNYAIIPSSDNKQYIDPSTIYFVDSSNTYHTIYHFASGEVSASDVTGYKSQDFRKVKYEDDGKYFYRRNEYACYVCKVSPDVHGDIKSIINGNTILKQKYYTALARERYNLVKATATEKMMTYN